MIASTVPCCGSWCARGVSHNRDSPGRPRRSGPRAGTPRSVGGVRIVEGDRGGAVCQYRTRAARHTSRHQHLPPGLRGFEACSRNEGVAKHCAFRGQRPWSHAYDTHKQLMASAQSSRLLAPDRRWCCSLWCLSASFSLTGKSLSTEPSSRRSPRQRGWAGCRPKRRVAWRAGFARRSLRKRRDA